MLHFVIYAVISRYMTTMRVVGECFFWYRLTRVFPDKFHRAVKRLCVVCVFQIHFRLVNGPIDGSKETIGQQYFLTNQIPP